MSDEDDKICPLCCEDLDISDQNFLPCKCGYQVARRRAFVGLPEAWGRATRVEARGGARPSGKVERVVW